MSNEQFLEGWEQEKRRLAALGHQWSFADALVFSMRAAQSADMAIQGPIQAHVPEAHTAGR